MLKHPLPSRTPKYPTFFVSFVIKSKLSEVMASAKDKARLKHAGLAEMTTTGIHPFQGRNE